MKKGEVAVCYTRGPMNEWKTAEFVGDLNVGDKCVIGYSGAQAGKVIAASSVTPTLEVIGKISAMAGYEKPMVVVRVL